MSERCFLEAKLQWEPLSMGCYMNSLYQCACVYMCGCVCAVESKNSGGTPVAKMDVRAEVESPMSAETMARKKRWRKHFLNNKRMRLRVTTTHVIKYRNWLNCGTHPDYERWLHGSPDDQKRPIEPPTDIDKWIYCSPRRYLESDLGGPRIKRSTTSKFVKDTFTP